MPWPLLIPAITAAGSLLSGAAKGSADQRASENNQAAQRNQLLAQLYNTRQGATMNSLIAGANERSNQRGQALDERKFALGAPGVRAGQSVRGSIMQNAQPMTLSGLPDRIASRIPTISGGLSPALFNQNTRDLGGEMTRKALIDQLKGDEFAPMETTDFASGVLAAPKMEDYQKSGLLEKILGGLGLAGTVAGGIGGAIHSNKRVPVDVPYDSNESGGY